MKYLKFNISILFTLICGLAIGGNEYVKNISKTLPIASDGMLEVHNKYGKLNIHTGNINEAKFEITITVKAKSESKAQEILDRISVNFEGNGKHVTAQTNIDSNSSNWWPFGSKNNKINCTIDYDITIPSNCSTSLHNKYGNIYFEELNNDSEIELKYGNLQAGTINGDLNLQLGYGNAVVESCDDLELLIKYSKIELGNTEDQNIESKYSKLILANAGDTDVISKYDEIKLGDIEDINIEAKYGKLSISSADKIDAVVNYTDVILGTLKESGTFEVSYGNTKIMGISKSLNSIDYIGKHTDLIIDSDGTGFRTYQIQSKHADIRLPEDKVNVTRRIIDGSDQTIVAEGTNKANSGNLVVEIKYGKVKNPLIHEKISAYMDIAP